MPQLPDFSFLPERDQQFITRQYSGSDPEALRKFEQALRSPPVVVVLVNNFFTSRDAPTKTELVAAARTVLVRSPEYHVPVFETQFATAVAQEIRYVRRNRRQLAEKEAEAERRRRAPVHAHLTRHTWWHLTRRKRFTIDPGARPLAWPGNKRAQGFQLHLTSTPGTWAGWAKSRRWAAEISINPAAMLSDVQWIPETGELVVFNPTIVEVVRTVPIRESYTAQLVGNEWRLRAGRDDDPDAKWVPLTTAWEPKR